MPFTPSHMAAVLPLIRLARGRLDATCLLIGAMAPDIEYFLRGRMAGGFGHKPLGLLVWCVPITLLTALLFHRVVKWPLLWMAPRAWQPRVVPELAPSWPRQSSTGAWLIAAVSALIGAVSHVAWDSLTHGRGWSVKHVGFLREFHNVPLLGNIQTARIFQHVSSVVGLIIMAWWLARRAWPTAQPVSPVDVLAVRQARVVLATLMLVGVVLLQIYTGLRAGYGSASIGDRVVALITGGSLGIIATCLLVSDRAARWRMQVTT